MEPLVSVVMATYNEKPEYVRQAIESLQNQTWENMEILILDDSTNEDSRAAIDAYRHDRRIQVIREDKRMGFVHALNIGLEKAKGRYIMRMDGDDIADKDRVARQAAYLESHKHVSVLGGQINIISENGEVISRRRYPQKGIRLYLFSLIRDPLAHPAVMMRRELIDAGFRYDEDFAQAEDMDLWLRILNSNHKIENIPEVLLDYRVTEDFNRKRCNRTTWDYMILARKKNASIRRPLFSVLSVAFALVRRKVRLNITAVFTAGQAKAVLDALEDGTENIVSVFAGRIADAGEDPEPIMRRAAEMCREKGAMSLWASCRKVFNIMQADRCGADIITVTNDILARTGSIGKDLEQFSLETVQMFERDGRKLGFAIE